MKMILDVLLLLCPFFLVSLHYRGYVSLSGKTVLVVFIDSRKEFCLLFPLE